MIAQSFCTMKIDEGYAANTNYMIASTPEIGSNMNYVVNYAERG